MAWNRASTSVVTQKKGKGFGRLTMVLLVVLLLVVAGILLFALTRKQKEDAQIEKSYKPKVIKDVTQADVKVTQTPQTQIKKPMTEAERIFNETNGMSLGALRQWEFKNWKGPVYTNGANRKLTLPERVFSNSSDRLIASLVLINPGETLIGESRFMFTSYFRKMFMKSLEEPIVISENDTDEVKELKQSVADIRKELKERSDAGEDVCEILAKTRDEYRQLGLYRQEIEKMVKETLADHDFSDNDIKDCISAANKMLEERGAKPLTMPMAFAKLLRMKQLKAEAKLMNTQGENKK